MSKFCLGCVKVSGLKILLHCFGKPCLSYHLSYHCLDSLVELGLVSCFLLKKAMHYSIRIIWLVLVKPLLANLTPAVYVTSFSTLISWFTYDWKKKRWLRRASMSSLRANCALQIWCPSMMGLVGRGKSNWHHLFGLLQSIWHYPTWYPCL